MLPFEGIRVADFGWVIASPTSTQWLASMGAEVILVENHAHLNVHRIISWGGVKDGQVSDPDVHGGFNSLNYSKRSCLLNLSTPTGKDLAKRLVARSDVVTMAYTARAAERLGLSYDELREVNPSIVYLSVSTFGLTGPLRQVAGYGPASQHYVGLPAMTGYPGAEGGAPMGGAYPDYLTGMVNAYLLSAALYRRRLTGEGTYIDVAMVESVLNMMPEALLDLQMNDRVAQPKGNADQLAAPHDVFRCKGDDRWVALMTTTEDQWRALCNAAGHPEWLDDDRFTEAADRRLNAAALYSELSKWTATFDAEDLVMLLQSAGVPAALSANSHDLSNDPQLRHRGQFITLDHPKVGPQTYLGQPGIFSAIPDRQYFPTPVLGEHDEYVYREVLGISAEELREPREAGIAW